MANYYVNDNPQPTGEHEVHTDQCLYFSQISSKTPLGSYNDCSGAIAAAKSIYSNVDGCFWCSTACHRK